MWRMATRLDNTVLNNLNKVKLGYKDHGYEEQNMLAWFIGKISWYVIAYKIHGIHGYNEQNWIISNIIYY